MRLAVYDTNALIQSPPPTVTTPTFTLEKGDLGYPVYRTAGRYTRLPHAPSFRPTAFEQARGGALGAGGGRVGFAGGGLF